MSSAEAELELPRDGFVPRTDVARPDAPATSSIQLQSFEAQTNGNVSWVAACYRGSAPGWNGDVDELVEHRLAELAVWFAGPLGDTSTLHVTTTERAAGVTVQRLEAANGLRARTFLGFRDGTPIACVLSCGPEPAPPSGTNDAACPALVEAAHLRAPLDPAPPSEGILLGATAAMVHHPAATVGTFVGLVVVTSLLLAMRRRGPTRRRRTNF